MKYLEVTAPLRQTESQRTYLWLSLNFEHIPVISTTIPSWVKTIIIQVKVKMNSGTFRSVTATRAFCNNVNFGMIMAAGDWSQVSTPMNHYFRTYAPCTCTMEDTVKGRL